MLDRNQFEAFIESVFVAFPNVYQTLKFGVDLEATKNVWFAALKQFDAEELRAVLNEWIHSRDVPFKANEIGFLQNIIRARIYFQRDQIAKMKRSQEEFAKIEQRKKSYERIPVCERLYDIGLRANQLVESGRMSEEEWRLVCQDLSEQAGRSDLSQVVDPIEKIIGRSRSQLVRQIDERQRRKEFAELR